jgi:hypothetical protein
MTKIKDPKKNKLINYIYLFGFLFFSFSLNKDVLFDHEEGKENQLVSKIINERQFGEYL